MCNNGNLDDTRIGTPSQRATRSVRDSTRRVHAENGADPPGTLPTVHARLQSAIRALAEVDIDLKIIQAELRGEWPK